MANRLVNTVTLPGSALFPGDEVDDSVLAEVLGAGGTVVSDANPVIASAAELCQSLRLSGRLNSSDLSSVMVNALISQMVMTPGATGPTGAQGPTGATGPVGPT